MSNDVRSILSERHSTHGLFTDQGKLAQQLKTLLRSHSKIEMDRYQVEAMEMICTKLSRIVCGNPHQLDSWLDIAGYAQLVVDELQRNAIPEFPPPYPPIDWKVPMMDDANKKAPS